MLPALTLKSARSAAIGLAATAAVLGMYVSQTRVRRGAPEVPIEDGKTIDFSGGSPVVRSRAADKASMDAALRQIDEATRDTTVQAPPPDRK